jgi:hypothetical protein
MRPHNSFSENICFEFSLLCLCQFVRKPVLCWQAVRGDRGKGEDLPVHAAGPRGGALHQAHSARSVSSLLADVAPVKKTKSFFATLEILRLASG